MSRQLEIIAHRGFSAIAPENTLRAFAEAIACGADRIELDVQLTRDGVPVVLHDDLLDRTTSGKGLLRELDRGSLRGLDAGSWFSPAFRGEGIPTLDEVLDLCRGRIAVNVEIKAEEARALEGDQGRGTVGDPGVEARVVDAIVRRGLAGSVIISSFDGRALERVRELDPRIEIERLHDGAEGPPGPAALERARALGAAGLNVSLEELGARPRLPREAHDLGLRLKVYTIDEPADMERAVSLGVDGIFTNRPDRLLDLLERGRR